MSGIWDCFMFRDEFDMLRCRLEALTGWAVRHVLIEAPVTHRGVPKRLNYFENAGRFADWNHRITAGAVDLPQARPWEREHAQRNAAWPRVDRYAADEDIVLICDADEIPSRAVLEWDGPDVAAVWMRTCIYAVDWEVADPLPPTCVVARAGYLRRMAREGLGLAEVRDRRGQYPVIQDGGWHLSWLGGPEKQAEKLMDASCHKEEIVNTGEAAYILDGRRYREGLDGGGLRVRAVDVDSTWPRYVYERRCPASWFRPRGNA